jgi:membrane protease YdiL (CAAX protease family)
VSVNGQVGYMDDVLRPATCLVFLLPMVILYEVGVFFAAGDMRSPTNVRVIAFELLQKFSGLFGASGYYMPGLLVVIILVAWQIASGGKWRVQGKTILGMALESIMLAIPLLVLAHVASSFTPVMAAGVQAPSHAWLSNLLVSVGAGIYEELLFRLIFISVLSIVLMDLLGVDEGPAIFSIVIISAVVFSLYHYMGEEKFTWNTFVFRTMAGGYFAGVFILRGFGIVVGCHVLYDLMATLLVFLSR